MLIIIHEPKGYIYLLNVYTVSRIWMRIYMPWINKFRFINFLLILTKWNYMLKINTSFIKSYCSHIYIKYLFLSPKVFCTSIGCMSRNLVFVVMSPLVRTVQFEKVYMQYSLLVMQSLFNSLNLLCVVWSVHGYSRSCMQFP